MSRLTLTEYVEGVLRGDRSALARAITLIESDLPVDNELASQILDRLPRSDHTYRIAITGAPGVGKSTFIDALGMHLVNDPGHRVAVLSVDPSSIASGGSILGDKTRMERLSLHDRAFIRPTPARGHLGGVARSTRETIVLCEAAGYDIVLVETVGVGQSETAVHSMVDFFLLLMIPGAGDELQGIKRGIIEMLDGMVINKADNDTARAERARAEYSNALHLFPPRPDGWVPRVLTCSALTGQNVPAVWPMLLEYRKHVDLSAKRRQQAGDWMHELVSLGLQDSFRRNPAVSRRLPEITDAVRRGELTPSAAARELLRLFRS